MTFVLIKLSFLILFTYFNVKLTFCKPDNESAAVNVTSRFSDFGYIPPTGAGWYDYNVVTEDQDSSSEPLDFNFSLKPVTTSGARNLTNFHFKFEVDKENVFKNNQTIRIHITPNNTFGFKQNIYNIPNNTEVESLLNRNSDNVSATDEPKRISEIKCGEYGQAVARKVWALALVGTDPKAVPLSSQRDRCDGVHTPLIVGGTVAQPGEFPHMAALGWSVDDQIQYLCGGSLISERWVLTAAHCTHGHSGSPTVVRLGTHLLSDNKLGEVFEIENIKIHPTYKPPAMYADIALLELKTPVTFKDSIRPTCLYQEYDAAPAQAWATGWGITEIGEERSDELRKAQLNILDTVLCARNYNKSAAVPRGIVPSMLCAGDSSENWQSDTCQGDSGGPLQVIHPTIGCLYQQVGITSFGKLCAIRESPGVYTRVSQYLNWIEDIVWPGGA